MYKVVWAPSKLLLKNIYVNGFNNLKAICRLKLRYLDSYVRTTPGCKQTEIPLILD